MHFEGKTEIESSRENVWSFLMNFERLATCLPNLEKVSIKTGTSFVATIRIGIGFIKGKYDFRIEILEKTPPVSARLTAHGSGPGSVVDLDSRMELTNTIEGGTDFAWKADVRVGGLLSGLGQRFFQGTANEKVTEFFDCIKNSLESEA